ncbi:MAG TPA: alpha/beta hydrolase family protein [Verrucomicrobiae bacterium]|nr:alpha/beta hydrolase family protein [Verrucomicrobiae bacterium]
MRRALTIGLTFAVAVSWSPARGQSQAETPEQFYQRLSEQQQLPSAPVRSEGSGVTAQDVVFQSRTLDREMRYRVLLPASYGSAHRYYPVLYLLHGYMNTYYDWDKQTNLARDLEKYDLIVVMPEFDNSFYLNSAGEPKDRYITYFFRDLTPDVERRFRARTETPARAIAGVSMGGYGAMLWALRYPQAFSFAADFSGSINFARDAQMAEILKPFDTVKLLGPDDSGTRKYGDIMALVPTLDASSLPYVWITCGADDPLLKQNLDFAEGLRGRHIAFELHSAPGGHAWVYWDGQLPSMLVALARTMRLPEAR